MGEPKTKKKPHYTSSGNSGTTIEWGQIQDVDISKLSRYERVALFSKMIKNPAISSSRKALIQSLLSPTWNVVSGKPGDSEADKYMMFVAESLGMNGMPGRMSIPFEEALAPLFTYEDYGWAHSETIYRRPSSPDDHIWLDRIEDRPQSSLQGWVRKGGSLHSIKQNPPSGRWGFGGYGKSPTINARDLLLLTREKRGDNYEGISTLEAVVYEARLMAYAFKALGVKMEKWAFGTPHLSYDREEIEKSLPSDLDFDAQLDLVKSNLKGYLAQEDGIIVTPRGFDLAVFGENNFDLSGFSDIERLITRRIQSVYLTQFMALGQDATGARSVGESQTSFFYVGVANSLDYFAQRFGGPARPGAGVIGRMIEVNFGAVDPTMLPKLQHRGLTTSPLMQALGQLAALAQNNVIIPTDSLEGAILSDLGLGAITEQSTSLRAAQHTLWKKDPSATLAPTTKPTPEE